MKITKNVYIRAIGMSAATVLFTGVLIYIYEAISNDNFIRRKIVFFTIYFFAMFITHYKILRNKKNN